MAGLDSALAGAVAWIVDNLLIDTVRIWLPAGTEPVFNPDTGELEYPPGAVVYEGPGAVQPGNASIENAATPDAVTGWVQETKSRYVLLTPLEAPLAPKDALVSVTAVHDPDRARLMGRVWFCADVSQAGTVEVVRRTSLDQNQAARPEVSP
ncbi:DUF6093 family protein [Streptomyces sp. NPDC058657]|uniref:DUF6093 family protein n=1 Tax=unclassified Streptomyces TaxID=2593676 RepID=UPI0036632931